MTPLRATIERPEPVERIADLKRAILVPAEDFERFLRRFDWTWHQLARGEYPPPFESLDELQLSCICADPYLWCSAFLRDPDDPDHKDPYSYWNYQIDSLRYLGNSVHQCGAEVGKSREILSKVMYLAYTRGGGSGLVGAPQQVHLMEIVDMITDQWSWNPELEHSVKRHIKAPHHAMHLTNGFRIYFRPSGHDGEAYRGVHVRDFAFKDEAAKDKHPKTWSEFWRAMKPTAFAGIYSVPDGDRSCDYYRICQSASDGDKEEDDAPQHDAQPDHGEPGGPGSHRVAGPDFTSFRKFLWPKTVMPPPFWSAERRRHYIHVYGGEDSPGYKHNVRGEHGDPEYSVFPTHHLNPCVREIPEYRVAKVTVDTKNNEVSIRGMKYGVVSGDDGPVPEEVVLIDDVRAADAFFARDADGDSDFARMIRSFFVAVPGRLYGGGDFGFSPDPTELVVSLILGHQERRVARLQLRSVTYDQQCEALDALDDLYDAGRFAMRWGTDHGNAGSAVAHVLQGMEAYRHKRYDERLHGYMFGSTTDNIDETGEYIIDGKTGKPARITLKELATDLMTKKIQRREKEYPPDPDILSEYPNHTVRQGQGRRLYKAEDDHQIDADRLCTLVRVMESDVFDFFE